MKNKNNAAYWRIREANAKARYIKEEIPYLEYIGCIYNDMLRNIQSEINNFFVKYARDKGITLAEAKRRADKLDIRAYEQKAKKYVNERNFSKRANEEMRLYNLTMKVNRLELLKANIGLEITTCNNDYEKFLSEKLEKRAIDEIKRQSGILGKTIVQNAKQIKSIVNGSFYSADFSHRIWGNSSILKSEIEKQLVRGLIGGKHPRELAQNLRKTITSGRYEAERLMRTELARVQTDAQKESYKTNNVEEYEYIGGQSRICPICAELDGKCFKVSEMRVGENAPPMHPNCRCATSATRTARDAWVDSGAAKNGVAYKDFKELYTPGKGVITFDKGFIKKDNKDEVAQAEWIAQTFGGSIKLLERSLYQVSPDFEWNNKYWDLKTPKSASGVDKLVHHGLKQINEVPGGILIDCSNQSVNMKKAIQIAERRLNRSRKDKKTIVIVKVRDEIVAILQ